MNDLSLKITHFFVVIISIKIKKLQIDQLQLNLMAQSVDYWSEQQR